MIFKTDLQPHGTMTLSTDLKPPGDDDLLVDLVLGSRDLDEDRVADGDGVLGHVLDVLTVQLPAEHKMALQTLL